MIDEDEPDRTLDPRLWDLYINDCQHLQLTPSIKDFIVWKDEQDYDG